MSDSVIVDVDALSVECPNCGMPPRHSCCANMGLGDSMGKPHVARVRDALWADRDSLRSQLTTAEKARDEARAECERLTLLINTPRTDEFFEAVRNEAAHQVERWGVDHDAGKRPEDWITLLVYLTGKASKAYYKGDAAKLKHHIVTVAAVCLNWLRNLNGETRAMRPGVGPEHALSILPAEEVTSE